MAKICQVCGNKNKETSEFCKNCGAFLDDIPVEKSTSGGLSWWDRQIILIQVYPALLLIPLALIFILTGFMLQGDLTDESSLSSTPFTVGNVSMIHYCGNGFSFDCPSKWEQRVVSSEYADMAFAAVDGNNLMCFVFNGTVGNIDNNEFKSLSEQYSSDYNTFTGHWEGIQIKKEDINQNGVEGFRVVFKCNKSNLNEGTNSTPAYIDEKLLIKGTEGKNLYLLVSTDYYEANKDLIDKTMNSFQIN